VFLFDFFDQEGNPIWDGAGMQFSQIGSLTSQASEKTILDPDDLMLVVDSEASNVIKKFKPTSLAQRVVKSSNESRNTTTTLTADSVLGVAVSSGITYHFKMLVFFTTAATPDFKYSFSGPALTSCRFYRASAVGGGTPAWVAVSTSLPGSTALAGSGTDGFVMMEGVVTPSASGNITFNWAQNTSDATNATVLAGSFMEIRRLT